MKIRTAIFGVYVSASAVGFILMMALVLRDVRLRYVESMRRTLADTAAFLGASVMQDIPADDSWPRKLATLPPNASIGGTPPEAAPDPSKGTGDKITDMQQLFEQRRKLQENQSAAAKPQ